MGLNVSPPIWQTYINTILNCLESKKYCEAIMDDLLIFFPSKQSHIRKLEDLLKGLTQEWTENIPKEVPIIQERIAIHGQHNLYSREKSMC